MTIITRERLLKIQRWRETYGPGSNVVLPAEEAEELARIALASLEAEPVAWIWKTASGYDTTSVRMPRNRPGKYAARPLYTAPPAPVVPTFDEWLEIRGNKPLGWVKDAMRESYDACRAAMLQCKAEPISNRDELSSPVIPDGYALVPKEPTEAMLLLLGLTGSFTAMDAAYQKMLAASPLHSATSTDI